MITAQRNNHSNPSAKSATAGIPAEQVDPILNAICSGQLSSLIEERKIAAETIAAWHAKPENQARLAQVLAAFDMQSQLVAARYRLYVMAALLRVVEDPPSKPETVRKACCDVVKMAPLSKAQKKNSADSGLEGPSGSEILAQAQQLIKDRLDGKLPAPTVAATSSAESKSAAKFNDQSRGEGAAGQASKSADAPQREAPSIPVPP